MSAAPAPAAPPAAAAAQSTPRRAKRETLGAAADASRDAADPLERELERIARLRAQGRDAEADAALERFRREHPDYRISPAMLEKVERRDGSKPRGTP